MGFHGGVFSGGKMVGWLEGYEKTASIEIKGVLIMVVDASCVFVS